jgi:hypothetical protein
MTVAKNKKTARIRWEGTVSGSDYLPIEFLEPV